MSTERAGSLQVIAGPMFAGKSEELMRRVHRSQLAGRRVLVLTHALDDRRGVQQVSTHTGQSLPATAAADAQQILALASGRGLDLLAIDEAQFFGPPLIPAVLTLAGEGADVVVSGLCVTFDAQPFPPLPELMALAEHVTKLTAVCAVCGAEAVYHRRVSASEVGDALVTRPEQTDMPQLQVFGRWLQEEIWLAQRQLEPSTAAG